MQRETYTMSEFDIGSDDAKRVILSIRDLPDGHLNALIAALSKDPNLIEGLEFILEDLDPGDPEPSVKSQKETKFRLPDNAEFGIKTKFLDANIDGNLFLIEKHLRDTDPEQLSKELTVLANAGFPLERDLIDPVHMGQGLYGFLNKIGEPILDPQREGIHKFLENHYQKYGDSARAVSENPLQNTDGIERRFARNEVDSVQVAATVVDYSLGEGQHISARDSAEITGTEQPFWGLSEEERKFSEIHFRDIGPRGRLEHLRRVYHTRPAERGKFSIRSLKMEGVTLLLLGNRVLTFGWTRKLPRVPNWTLLGEPARLSRTVDKRVNQNRYSLLGD